MARSRLIASLFLLLCLQSHGAVAAIRCTLDPEHPDPGQPLSLVIEGDPLPSLKPADFSKDWQIQSQGQSDYHDASGHRTQSLHLTLLPLHGGKLHLPASTGCSVLSIQLARSAGDAAAPGLSTRFVPARPMVGQAVVLQLVLTDGPGGVDWQDVDLVASDVLLSPLPPLDLHQSGHAQRIWSWSLLPLRPGPLSLQFGWLHGSHFGQPLNFPVAPVTLDVQPLPRYWSRDLPVGTLRLQLQTAAPRLRLGEETVLHADLELAGFDADGVRRLLQEHVDPAGFELETPRLRQLERRGVVQHWRVDWPVRARTAGRLRYPELRLPLLDPSLGAPRLVRTSWGAVEVDDPRLRRCLLGGATLALLLGGWLLLRLVEPSLRRLWRLLRWQKLNDAEQLEQAWKRDGCGRSARRWLQDAAASGLPVEAWHLRWLHELERRHYGAAATNAKRS